jgi:hypothetical protein
VGPGCQWRAQACGDGRLGRGRERDAGASAREERRSGPEAVQARGVPFFYFLFLFLLSPFLLNK